MEYMLKTIEEDTLEDFLFNPFERAAYYKGRILQKYAFREDADHVIRIDEDIHSCSAAFVLYEKHLVLYEEMFDSDNYFPKNDSFKKMKVQKEDIQSAICSQYIIKIEEKRKSFRADPKLKVEYDRVKKVCFQSLVNFLLGAESFDYIRQSNAFFQIRSYLMQYRAEEIVRATFDPTVYEPLIDQLLEDEEILMYDIYNPEVYEEAKKYVADGVFTEEERRLIDFISKTKDSGAKKFTVIKESGESVSCLNMVTPYFGVPLAKDREKTINLKDIDKVKYGSKVIYKKTI